MNHNRWINIYYGNLDKFLAELGIKIKKQFLVRKAFERYHNAVRLDYSLIAIESQKFLEDAVKRNFKVFEEQGIRQFIDQSLAFLPETTKKNIVDSESIKAAIIYELLSKYYEK